MPRFSEINYIALIGDVEIIGVVSEKLRISNAAFCEEHCSRISESVL